jgi:hypothetical protein
MNIPKFLSGNIIKSPSGSLWIVTDINEKYMSAVSFDSTNCSLGCSKESKRQPRQCECVDYAGESDSECEICNGTGENFLIYPGYDDFEFVASTVKDFIVNRALSIFKV